MSLRVIVYVLTAFVAAVVVLTRLRTRDGKGTSSFHVGRRVLHAHTVVGVLALACWTVFLAAPESSPVGGSTFGIIGLGLLWALGVLSLMMMSGWFPSRGKHATPARRERWWQGPELPILSHLGVVVAVGVFTYAYLTSVV